MSVFGIEYGKAVSVSRVRIALLHTLLVPTIVPRDSLESFRVFSRSRETSTKLSSGASREATIDSVARKKFYTSGPT